MRRRSTVGSTASAGSPAIRTAPPVGLRRRVTSFNVVVLPAPLRPSRTSVSPAPTENDIPSIRSSVSGQVIPQVLYIQYHGHRAPNLLMLFLHDSARRPAATRHVGLLRP